MSMRRLIERIEEGSSFRSPLKARSLRATVASHLGRIAEKVDATINDQHDFIALTVDGENAKSAIARFKDLGVFQYLSNKMNALKRAQDGTYPVVFEFDLSKISDEVPDED